VRREVTLPKLHSTQLEARSHAGRYNVLCCGRRWGKTKFGISTIARAMLLENPRPYAWFAPTYKALLEPWREFRAVLEPASSYKNESEKRIELVNGSTLDFWSLENTGLVARGYKYRGIFIDEAAMVRNLDEAWEASIRPTLTDYSGWAWFGSTPKGDGFYKDLFDKGIKQELEWRSMRYPSSSNPYLPDGEIDEVRRDMPELKFRQEYLAEFVVGAGTRVKREWLQTLSAPEHLEVSIGVDLAISSKADADFTAAVVLGRDSSTGKIWVLAAERIRGSFNQVLEFIQRLAARFNPRSIAIEQVQYQAAVVQELLRRTNLPVRGVRPDKDKVTRFQPLEARYEQGLVYHVPRLEAAFEAELLAFPLGLHDDMVDAAAYALGALGSISSFGIRASTAG
jgi:predicted phage terminase large subunit-like protein